MVTIVIYVNGENMNVLKLGEHWYVSNFISLGNKMIKR